MHELAVCQSLIGQVEAVARDRDARRVLSVTVEIGPLSGVVPDLLEQAWPIASAGTLGEGAGLIMNEASIRVRCCSCHAETLASVNRLVCGDCGEWRTELVTGDELMLTRIELETRDNRDRNSFSSSSERHV